MVDKTVVAQLYGAKNMVQKMSEGRPNAFLLLALPQDLADQRVLELFCGTGYLLNELAQRGATGLGIDISPAAIEFAIANSSPDLQFRVGEVESLDLLPEYDIVLAPFGFQYVQSPREVIQIAMRGVKPGGKLLIADAYKLGTFATYTGIPGQLFDMVKFGLSHGNSLGRTLSQILGSLKSFGLFGLPEWKNLNQIRTALEPADMKQIASELGGKYTRIGNSYFVIEIDV
jgi:SAM-dependent methyltransferase